MRKYLFIYKSEVMSSLQYLANILFGFLGYFIMLFIFFQLWKYLYSDPDSVMNGYTMAEMVWYVIMTEILWSTLGGKNLCQKISNDVKSGNIAYNLCKPYSYIHYALFSHLGSITIKAVLYTLLGLVLGFCFLGEFPNISFLSILLWIISSIGSLAISSLFVIFIGLFSFKIEDANPFYWVYSKFILILGTIFPIEFFPKILRPILRYSPIFATTYGPANLFVHFSFQNAFRVLIAQFIYLGIAYVLCYFVYQKGVKKLNVNGG